MKISERTKRLLNWWQLRIEKSREETKEKNVEREKKEREKKKKK